MEPINLRKASNADLRTYFDNLIWHIQTPQKGTSEADQTNFLLLAGIVRDEEHRRGERGRTNLMLVLTFVIAVLTFVVARASPDAFNFHPTQTNHVVVVPLSLAPSPPSPRDWH